MSINENQENGPCIRVARHNGESTKKKLREMGILDTSRKIKNIKDDLIIPILDPCRTDLLDEMGEVCSMRLETRKQIPRGYKDLVDIPEDKRELLPSSFDIIGDVCIIKLPDPIEYLKHSIGSALLEHKKNIRVVALDKGVMGDLRIRDLEVIAGENDMDTTHIENNTRLRLDPSRVYFSPRLATERARIAGMVKGGRILDMFAGVGPFSINCARNGSPDEIVGIDLNPDCIEYFNMNIQLNSCGDIINAYHGDAREATLGMGPFDRIIMNLPHGSMEFLDTAFDLIEEGIIHIYSIASSDDLSLHLQRIIGEARTHDLEARIDALRDVHNYSANSSMMAIDVTVIPIRA